MLFASCAWNDPQYQYPVTENYNISIGKEMSRMVLYGHCSALGIRIDVPGLYFSLLASATFTPGAGSWVHTASHRVSKICANLPWHLDDHEFLTLSVPSDQPKHDSANASALLFGRSFGRSWIGRNLHYSALTDALAISRSSGKQPMLRQITEASAIVAEQNYYLFSNSAFHFICGWQIEMFSW